MNVRSVLLLGLLVVAALAITPSPPIAREQLDWLADYEVLRGAMGSSYANLQQRLRARGVSPRELDRRTRQAILQARTRDEARAALSAFVGAFADNHLKVRPADATKSAPAGAADRLPASAPGARACEEMGFDSRDRGEIAWESLPGWRRLGGGTAARPFLAGTFTRDGDAAPIGLLRIHSFDARAFAALCVELWDRRPPSGAADCDPQCQDDFTLRVEVALLERLAAQLEQLRTEGVRELLVDVTGNGGGSSVADPLARSLTPVPLQEPVMGFTRHPHWEARFSRAREAFAGELRKGQLSATHMALLANAQATAERARRVARDRCEDPWWTYDSADELCDPVSRFEGFLRYAGPGELADVHESGILFNPSQYSYREGAWRGRLIVVIDRWTASAAEGFSALLRDNDAAILLGERTMGSGCGYTDGGIKLELPHLGVNVRMPDCVRYRRDGRSEAEGIDPDIVVPWAEGDDGPTRAAKVVRGLAQRGA